MLIAKILTGLLIAAALVGCEESDPIAGNPQLNQQQLESAQCVEKGGSWVYDNNGFTCANPSPELNR